MSNNRAVRSSQNFKPKNKSYNNSSKSNTSYKQRGRPKYKSGAKPNNRARDAGKDQRQRGPPRKPQNRTNYRSSERSSSRYDSRDRRQSDRGSKELHPATCAKCMKETQVPFKPTGSKPVLCRECFQVENPSKGSSGTRRVSQRSSSRYQDRSRNRSDGRTKQLFDVICARCNKETQVPFKPTGTKPVLCRECFKKPDSESKQPQIAKDASLEKEVVERFGDRVGPYRTNKRMHQTTCRSCKKEITIPFKPKANKKIYCQDCFQKADKNK
jgi:CxxC-x17-CxxC domain-containing protein